MVGFLTTRSTSRVLLAATLHDQRVRDTMPKNSSKKKKKKKSSGGSRKKGQAAGDAGRGPSRQAKETLEENKKELLSYINTIQQVAISPTSANWTTWNRITDISKNVENIVKSF